MTQREYLEYLQILKAKKEQDDLKRRKVYLCTTCNKQFSSQNAFRQHCESSKHQLNLAEVKDEQQLTGFADKPKTVRPSVEQEYGNTLIITEVAFENKEKLPAFLSPDEYETFKAILPQLETMTEADQDKLITTEILAKRVQMPQSQCLFCSHIDDDFTQLMTHMYQQHSFMIPFSEYCTSQRDLVTELQKQTSVARSCLVCMRGFKSAELCQKHMCGSGHTVFKPEEFVQQFPFFYDFTSSYPPQLLELIKAENDEALLKEIQGKRYYMTLDDIKYFVEGEQVGYLDWKEWKSYHVPEWLKIKKQQLDLLRSLKRLKGNVYEIKVKEATKEGENTETSLILREEVQQVVDKINQLGATSKSTEVIRITAANIEKYIIKEDSLRPAEIERVLRNKRDTVECVNERINHDKPFFKRSTLYIWN